MRKVTAIIVGAGQAGLAMSRCLTARSIDHVVLERGEVANSWRTERWESLRLLTPNWMSGLPGQPYDGQDPDGFLDMNETAAVLDRYANHVEAPIQTHTAVVGIEPAANGYVVRTDRGSWNCRAVVLASGACNIANRPRWAASLCADIQSLTPIEYRNPEALEPGNVLIVGASASGVQLAREIQLSGRQVTLATGEHVRAPRTYRGRDIMRWMDACGILSRRIEDADDVLRARRVPSLQLAGGDPADTIDLNSLQAVGIELTGRAMACSGSTIQFSGGLANACALADLKMNRMLGEIDAWIERNGVAGGGHEAHRFEPTRVFPSPQLSLDLARSGIRTVIWATGYRPDYSWLKLPVFTPRGELRHDRGIVDAPGLYVLGLPFMRTRRSSFIAGVGEDAEWLAGHLHQFLDGTARAAA